MEGLTSNIATSSMVSHSRATPVPISDPDPDPDPDFDLDTGVAGVTIITLIQCNSYNQ